MHRLVEPVMIKENGNATHNRFLDHQYPCILKKPKNNNNLQQNYV